MRKSWDRSIQDWIDTTLPEKRAFARHIGDVHTVTWMCDWITSNYEYFVRNRLQASSKMIEQMQYAYNREMVFYSRLKQIYEREEIRT